MSRRSASKTMTMRRGAIMGSVAAASIRSSAWISAPKRRSTLKARSPSSTISANSAAAADFSLSSSPSSTYSGPVSPAAMCFLSAAREITGMNQPRRPFLLGSRLRGSKRLDYGGDDRARDVVRDAVERAELLVHERGGVDGRVASAGRQIVLTRKCKRIVRPERFVDPTVDEVHLHGQHELIPRCELCRRKGDRRQCDGRDFCVEHGVRAVGFGDDSILSAADKLVADLLRQDVLDVKVRRPVHELRNADDADVGRQKRAAPSQGVPTPRRTQCPGQGDNEQDLPHHATRQGTPAVLWLRPPSSPASLRDAP